MNKLCYRVIFNKTRGLLMAVSELGRSHGAAPGADGMATSAVPPLNAARLQPLAFAVLVLAGAQLLTLPAAQAQIVADPSAPRSQQAVVVTTANGLPQVNITTPSAAGVSRNTYSQFDVNKPGAILNNARNDVQTRLGGWIQRNPNLATGTAGVILNEVNSANPSFLRGYVEVAGDRAQVIIANPSGVTCDGCGFINASRTTLTTGTAIMNNGNLDGFVVRRGTVTVQGEGLDSSQSDYTHIIARAVRINAGLWSRDLRITTGANRVNADNQVVEKLDGEGDTPSLSIDVAQLGGMYANKIVLVGTEAGVGVRNAGTIGAAAGEVRISAAGHIENTGKIQSTQTASIAATSLDNRGGKLQATSDLDVTLGSGALDNRAGLLDTSANLRLQAAGIDNRDTGASDQGLHGATISVQAQSLDNQRGSMLASQSQTLRTERSLDNSGGVISAAGDLSISGSNLALTNAGGQIQTNAALQVQAASISNTGTSGASQGLLGKRLTLDADVIDTVGSTEGNVAISAGSGYKQVGSNVMAPKGDIDIIAKKISILAETDSERNTQDVVFKQSGLTLQITSPVLAAIQTVQQMKKAAESTTDGRMKLLAAANIGFAGKNAYDAVKTGQGVAVEGKDNPQVLTNARNEDGSLKMGADGKPETRDATAADKAGGINLSISLGASKNESHSESSANTAKGSTVAAGGNVNITATGGGTDSNIVIQGSDIKAGVNATLKADNEVRLLAAQSTTEQHSTNKGMSGAVGVSFGTDGLLFNAGVSGSRGRGDGSDVAQVNTHVDAGNKLTIESGTDTTLKGAVVSGKQVVMEVGTSGKGNLNIESLQDASTYKSNQQSVGVSVSVGTRRAAAFECGGLCVGEMR